ncbi:hypothetical protein JCM16775_0416 [Leptotrichia hofstadii]|uniref:Uncharacterized protein n=1 Tax=Leptotrichia hofstadii TaxID=157688 RepID=A0A510JF42_9FUSO|nr:hypothetical protein [Leptotrichia hofstadii]BBM37726.1 hypothetical protein JCM16775_0416 [Leptotrichia hofstadii]
MKKINRKILIDDIRLINSKLNIQEKLVEKFNNSDNRTLKMDLQFKSPRFTEIKKGAEMKKISFELKISNNDYEILNMDSEYIISIMSESSIKDEKEVKKIEKYITNLLRVKITEDINAVIKNSIFPIGVPHTIEEL